MEALVVVIVMRVLLFVLHVFMLRKCEGARVTEILVCGDGGGVVVVSPGHVGGTYLQVLCLGQLTCQG